MPTYAFFCNSCKKEFTAMMTITEHEKSAPPACTHCGSKDVVAEFSAPAVITSKKS